MAATDYDYGQAMKQADIIDQIAAELFTLADSEVDSAMDSINRYWQGDAARAFIGNCAATQDDLRQRAQSLRDASQRLRDLAKTILR